MTCKDCLHGDMCEGYMPTDLDKDVWHYCREGRADQIPDIEERCSSFEDRTKYVEVVRCKDCIYNETGSCSFSKYVNPASYNPNWFCADGERRENDSGID